MSIADFLSDKSITLSKDQWSMSMISRLIKHYTASGPAPTSKSMVVYYLSGEEISVKDVIDLIDEGIYPEEWRETFAVSKEKELKLDNTQIYVKMPFEMHLYQTATEINLASQISRWL